MKNPIRSHFSPERFVAMRKSLGLNQKDFAEQVGICQSAVSTFEKGRRVPTLDILCSMADRLGVKLSVFLELVEPVTEKNESPEMEVAIAVLLATIEAKQLKPIDILAINVFIQNFKKRP